MKKSEALKLIEAELDQWRWDNCIGNAEDILYIIEKIGMLPPQCEYFYYEIPPQCSCYWEPEDEEKC